MSRVYHFTSVAGFRYFIVFVDDYSKMTWVYMLKDRTQVLDVLKIFYNKIKTQFFTSIHVLRTDNALEFLRYDVSQFCTHTSQQNDIVKKNIDTYLMSLVLS